MQDSLGLILYMAFFFVLIYFLLIRPQKKKTKQLADLRNSLKPGDEVTTIGGVVGKVLNVKDDDFVLEVGASKTKLTFKKWAVSTIDSAADVKVETRVEEPKSKSDPEIVDEPVLTDDDK
jgi:preprotein translocase subunit YajC